MVALNNDSKATFADSCRGWRDLCLAAVAKVRSVMRAPNVSELAQATKATMQAAQIRWQRICDRQPAALAANRGILPIMGQQDARYGDAVAETLDGLRSDGGRLAVAAVVAFGLLGLFALFYAGSAEPIIVLLLALLATVGVFFLLGLATNRIQLVDRSHRRAVAVGVVEGLQDAVQVTDRLGRHVYGNRAFMALAGYSSVAHEGIEQRALEHVMAGQPDAMEAYFRLARAAERGDIREETFFLPRPAPSEAGTVERCYRLVVRPLEPNGPQADAVHGWREPLSIWTLSDISAQRAQEAENVKQLQASLIHYEHMPAGLFVVDGNGQIEFLNATLARWLGISPGWRNQGLKITDVVSGDGAALLRTLARDSATGLKPIELDLLDSNGRSWPARLVVSNRSGAHSGAGGGGRGTGFVAAVLDRTSDVTALPESSASASRFARLFQSAPFGIAVVGAEGRITSSNNAFARLLLASGKVEGKQAVALLGPEITEASRTAFDQVLKAALAGKANLAPLEIAVGDNAEFTRRVVVTALGRSANTQEAAILYIMDATEQKALEVSFAQSQKMEAVGKLAGGIAHDFNNVLTAIIGFSDLLLQTHRPTDAPYKNIVAIKHSANRAAGMVSQLLAFSRRQTLQPEVLQLGEALGDLAVMLNRLLGEKIDLKILQGRDLWYVKADHSQLSQVIINLAVNARDAMPEGGRLKINTRNVTERESQRIEQPGFVVGEYVLIEVEDTGCGMPPEVVAKIFEPFFTTKGVGKGTGLGLSTVYGIVKQTGGFVFLDSVPGKGTTFSVYLPRHHVEAGEEPAGVKATKKNRAVDLTGSGRVLLVEDEDAVRGFAVEALKRQGYEVLQASSGVEALEVIAATSGTIDLVVSDVIMPEMDGPTLLKELRRVQPKLKFVFMSGYPDDAFKNTLDPGTEFAFLQKPFSLVQLATKVKEQLGR